MKCKKEETETQKAGSKQSRDELVSQSMTVRQRRVGGDIGK